MKQGSKLGRLARWARRRQGIARSLRGRGVPVLVLAAVGVLGTASGFAVASKPDDTGQTQVTICHHAGPNPDNWQTIAVDGGSSLGGRGGDRLPDVVTNPALRARFGD